MRESTATTTDPQPPGVGTDHLLVPLDELVLGVEAGPLRRQAFGHQEAGRQERDGEDGPRTPRSRPALTSKSLSQTEWRLTDENHSASV